MTKAIKIEKDDKAMTIKNKKGNVVCMDNPVVTAASIDRLTGVVNLSDKALNGIAFSGILDNVNNHTLGYEKVPVAGKYQLSVNIRVPDANGLITKSSPGVLLQITHPNASKRQVRFDYNPNQLMKTAGKSPHVAAFDYLDVAFMELFGIGFHDLHAHARFTRVDFCRDILCRSMEEYLILGKWKKVSQSIFGVDGTLQTINLGKSGNNQIVAYDKMKQLYGSAAQGSTIRIEARCRINLTLDGLAAFKNPFDQVQVFSIGVKNPPFGIAHWRAFEDSCRLRGVGNALKRQPVEYRGKLKNALSQHPVPWWSMSAKEWDFLLTAALEDAGLTEVPPHKIPLAA